MLKNSIFLLTFFLFINCNKDDNTIVLYDNLEIEYQGRIDINKAKKATELYWPGTAIKVNFKGTDLKVTLADENGKNYFNIFIDGEFLKFIKLESGKKTYTLAENLEDKNHSLEITKRNEWIHGKTLFYNFEIKGKLLKRDPEKELFLEFYGDSITVGHGNEDYSGKDESNGLVTNNYYSYAAITARNLNANYACIARGGVGILVSWHNIIMQEMYDLKDPTDKNSIWNFSTKKPNIVVINLLQNDSWLINLPNHIEHKKRFGNKKPSAKDIELAYANFVKTIRNKYKEAKIICILGNMDITRKNSPWINYVSNAVESLNDNEIYTCFVPYKNTAGHPKVGEQKIIAKQLTAFIKKEIL